MKIVEKGALYRFFWLREVEPLTQQQFFLPKNHVLVDIARKQTNKQTGTLSPLHLQGAGGSLCALHQNLQPFSCRSAARPDLAAYAGPRTRGRRLPCPYGVLPRGTKVAVGAVWLVFDGSFHGQGKWTLENTYAKLI